MTHFFFVYVCNSYEVYVWKFGIYSGMVFPMDPLQ